MDNILVDENTVQPKKRGRKPSNKRKGYFYEEEEEAFIKFINATDQKERDMIFSQKLYPAFTKMVESIIRTYELFIPSEEFMETFYDTMSFLITKANNFNSTKGWVSIDKKRYIVTENTVEYKNEMDETETLTIVDDMVTIDDKDFVINGDYVEYDNKSYKIQKFKAYSYCGTVCKNYLFLKKNQYKKRRDKNIPYDVMFPTAERDSRVDDNEERYMTIFHNDLINQTISEIQKMLSVENIGSLTENEQKIGHALLEMLMNWEEIFKRLENKKFNKTSVWFFLKERTDLDSKNIREGMKKYKDLYFFTKQKLINE